jgi:hypothetical protein
VRLGLDIVLIQEPYSYKTPGDKRQWKVPGFGAKTRIVPTHSMIQIYSAIIVSNENLDMINISEPSNQNFTVIEISNGKNDKYICVSAYFPPSQDIAPFMAHLEKIIS